MSEFPIKKKTHRTKPGNYYNRKREKITTTERRVSPTDRLCAEERRDARKPVQKENRPFEAILGQGWKGEFRNATRRILGIFDGSKIKQVKESGS